MAKSRKTLEAETARLRECANENSMRTYDPGWDETIEMKRRVTERQREEVERIARRNEEIRRGEEEVRASSRRNRATGRKKR